jgi:hypothetical protein
MVDLPVPIAKQTPDPNAGSAIPADQHFEVTAGEHPALDGATQSALLAGHGGVGILLFHAVLHGRVKPMLAVVLTDSGPARAVQQLFPADIVGGLANVLATDDDVGFLGPLVAAVG